MPTTSGRTLTLRQRGCKAAFEVARKIAARRQ